MKIRVMFFLSILLAMTVTCLCAASECCQIVSGTVQVDGKPLTCAKVKLYEMLVEDALLLENTNSDRQGKYQISFKSKKGSLLYLLAYDPDRPEIVLIAAFESGDSSKKVIINELTTVASVYALSQFIEKDKVFGPSPGLENSVGTIGNLVDLCKGTPGPVISNYENGAHENRRSTRALVTQNTLANLIAGSASNPELSRLLFTLVSQNGESVNNTLQAIHSIARNPFTQNNVALYDLATKNEVFKPTLEVPPKSWALALHFTRNGFSAPGRMAFDSKGHIWVNNNWLPPAGSSANIPGRQFQILSPQGKPLFGSPIYSKYVEGSGYGLVVDQHNFAWISSFHDGQIAKFTPEGHLAIHSTGLDHPMGIAVDQKGNLWSTNLGKPGDPLSRGSVTVFIGGDPNNRINHTTGVFKPFDLAIDNKGHCWVTNGGFFDPRGSLTILKLTANNKIKVIREFLSSDSNIPPIEPGFFPSDFASPKSIAIDSHGNGWTCNFEAPLVSFVNGKTFEVIDYPVDPLTHGWGIAIDGGGLVWISSFSNILGPGRLLHLPPVISVVSANESDRGKFLYSFSNPALQHLTALQIDSSGNVWVANNWGLNSIPPSPIYSGDGLVQFIGLATPVLTPLIGQPVNPADGKQ